MMYTIHAGGAVLAELDLEALYQQGKSPLQVGTLQPCPSCGETPTFYKDRGCWYMVGAIHICPGCGGRVWALPDEEEAADMMARQNSST